VDAGDGASGFGAFASDAKNELGHYVEKIQIRSNCIHLLFNLGSWKVLYRHHFISSSFTRD